jgi:hypothetical protein
VFATVNEIVTREAPDVREVRPDCPAALAELLAGWLRQDSRRRPGSAQIMTAQLDELRGSSADSDGEYGRDPAQRR